MNIVTYAAFAIRHSTCVLYVLHPGVTWHHCVPCASGIFRSMLQYFAVEYLRPRTFCQGGGAMNKPSLVKPKWTSRRLRDGEP